MLRDLRCFDKGLVSERCDYELKEPEITTKRVEARNNDSSSRWWFWLQLEKLWDPQSANARRELRTYNFEFWK